MADTPSPPTPNDPAVPVAASALSGWASFQEAVDDTLPELLTKAEAVNRATLELLK